MSQLILQFKVYKKANEKEGYFNSYTEHFIKYFDKKVQFEKINCYVLHLQSCVQDFGVSTYRYIVDNLLQYSYIY